MIEELDRDYERYLMVEKQPRNPAVGILIGES
jgi:hypothetical protein